MNAIPKYVAQILSALTNAGFQAYLVGGCVRDIIRGVRPSDWDIATSALPEQVSRLFKRTVPTGIKHGTVSVITQGKCVEVTTFRTEGRYSDNRHPERVVFVTGIEDDLARRDFTINAIAMSLDGEITDPFFGIKDINSGLIRCVGDPKERFSEDALRMLRALRFASVTGYEIEENTLKNIGELSSLAFNLSPERVCSELKGILLSDKPAYLALTLTLGLLDNFLDINKPDIYNIDRIGLLPRRIADRFAGFCALLNRANSVGNIESFLRALKLDAKTIKACAAGVNTAVKSQAPINAASWKRLLNAIGKNSASCAAAAWDCLENKGAVNSLSDVLKSGECWSVSGLRIDGEKLVLLGYPKGREVGRALKYLLNRVIDHPTDNEPEKLLALAKRLKEEIN